MAGSGSTGATPKRRDFLAALSSAPLLALWMPRAAYAQNASTAAPADGRIARVAVYPPIGISRIGNSSEWFPSPEVPGLPAARDRRYKDDQQRVKKQVQRFRIYGFNRAGEVVREVTAAEARIEWTVHVANTKAAWYGFTNPMDNGALAPAIPTLRRNQDVLGADERAATLVIDPGPKTISGAGVNSKGDDPAHAMVGRFWKKLDVKLGHLQTDAAGRLLVVPGEGLSRTPFANNQIANFSDNDGWHDDLCDGVVQARVRFNGGVELAADNGWIVCAGPRFAPDIEPFVTLYDVMTDVMVEAGWAQPAAAPLSFRKHIYPLFRRLALLSWVTSAHQLSAGWIGFGDFDDPALLARLANPDPANKAFRDKILGLFRDPNSDAEQRYKLPYLLGDGMNYLDSPLRWLRIPKRQYTHLQLWADGRFVDDLGGAPAGEPETLELDQLPLAERPEALTRAALEQCSGAALHPGVEMTWPTRHRELYRAPYRFALATNRRPDLIQDFGLQLTPERAFGGVPGTPPAVGPQMPGDVTRWLGLPWQCDVFACQQIQFANDFPIASWWPAHLPVDVLPEAYYRAVMDPTLSAEQRVRFFENRVPWTRSVSAVGLHSPGSYFEGIARTVNFWDRLGFVVRKPGPTDPGKPASLPAVMYVEVERDSMDPSDHSPTFQPLGPLPRR